MASPSPSDGAPRSRLPFLPFDDDLEVNVLRGIHDLRSAGTFICLDDEGTRRRDDAYLIKRDRSGDYRIFIAISPISVHTKFSWNNLKGYIPFEVERSSPFFSVHGIDDNYALGQGEGEAIVFDIATDLNELRDVALYRSRIDSVAYSHPWKTVARNNTKIRAPVDESVRIPRYLQDEFTTVTGAASTREGVARLMRMQNALSARALIQNDVSGIFDSYDGHGRLHFTHDGADEVVAAKASSPLRLSIDRINSAQIASLFRSRHDAFSPELCERLCAAAAKGYRGHRAA